MAHMYHIPNLAPVSKENKRCTSQHTHITIVEFLKGHHFKASIFYIFVEGKPACLVMLRAPNKVYILFIYFLAVSILGEGKDCSI